MIRLFHTNLQNFTVVWNFKKVSCVRKLRLQVTFRIGQAVVNIEALFACTELRFMFNSSVVERLEVHVSVSH
jgi:hypothetical protein